MTRKVLAAMVFLLVAISEVARAGDSMWGQVTSVPSAEVVVLRDSKGGYEIRIAGVDVPLDFAEEARQLVVSLVLNKNARMRFEYRDTDGQMIARLFTDDPVLGIRDVAVELLRAGFARRDPDRRFNDKYGELAAAEEDARKNRRGLWAQIQ